MTDAPAFIRNGRLDVLAVNDLGRALYSPLFADASFHPSTLPASSSSIRAAATSFPDWDESVNTTVALLRTEAGRAPHDSDLTGLVGELVTRSEEFRTAWAKHNVRLHHTGRKSFRHPAVGLISLDFDAMELPAQPGPHRLQRRRGPARPRLLAAWAATEQQDAAGTEAHGERSR
jgi:hypothetical protein